MITDLPSQWQATTIVLFTIDWVIRIVCLVYVPRNRKPTAAMAWLLAIFLIPILGVLIFLAIGSTKLSRERRAKQRTIDYIIESLAKPDADALESLPELQREKIAPIVNITQALGKLPVRSGNNLTLLPKYDEALHDLEEHIHLAKEYIYLEYYIIAYDKTTRPIFFALEQAVQRGVQVYVLFDPIGSARYKGYRQMKKELSRIGVRWQKSLPLGLSIRQYNRPDLRNHRKVAVIDDAYAYIGSQNLIARNYQRRDDIIYDELVVRMTGPIVNQCAVVFAGDWYSETNERLTHMTKHEALPHSDEEGALAQILPSGPGYTYENNLKMFVSLVYGAQKSIVITNPYFVPDEALLLAVISAVKRGVEVTIINSEVKDLWLVGHAQRSFYNQLLEAGVRIYLYKSPKLLHSKHITIDDEIAVVGSSNMDIRSFELNLECVVICYDRSFVKSLQAQQRQDIVHSRRVDLTTWQKRGKHKELIDGVARLTAGLQ